MPRCCREWNTLLTLWMLNSAGLCDNPAAVFLRRKIMQKQIAVLICTLVLCSVAFTQAPSARPTTAKVDKAYLQQIWDGWCKLDPSKQTQYYAKGPRTYFDIAPLKYTSWDE